MQNWENVRREITSGWVLGPDSVSPNRSVRHRFVGCDVTPTPSKKSRDSVRTRSVRHRQESGRSSVAVPTPNRCRYGHRLVGFVNFPVRITRFILFLPHRRVNMRFVAMLSPSPPFNRPLYSTVSSTIDYLDINIRYWLINMNFATILWLFLIYVIAFTHLD